MQGAELTRCCVVVTAKLLLEPGKDVSWYEELLC